MTLTPVQVAEVTHEANRVLRKVLGEDPGPSWADAPPWMHEASMPGAASDPEAEHGRWAAEKRARGYAWGPVRNDDPDAGPLTHPLLVPYAELSWDQRVKDVLRIAVTGALTGSAAA